MLILSHHPNTTLVFCVDPSQFTFLLYFPSFIMSSCLFSFSICPSISLPQFVYAMYSVMQFLSTSITYVIYFSILLWFLSPFCILWFNFKIMWIQNLTCNCVGTYHTNVDTSSQTKLLKRWAVLEITINTFVVVYQHNSWMSLLVVRLIMFPLKKSPEPIHLLRIHW